MGDAFGGYMASGLRSILVVAILLIPAVFYSKLEPINWHKNSRYVLGMVIASMFVWGPLYYAILKAGLAVALTINYASIVIGMFFFGWLWRGERFTFDKLLSTLLGIAGLIFIFSPTTTDLKTLPLLAALLSGLAISATVVLAKNLSYNSTQSTLTLWVTSVVANMPMALILREPIPSFGLTAEWGYLLLFALASVMASWMLLTGLKYVEAGAAGVLGLLEIVFGVLFGVLFFHEQVSSVVLSGIVIIISAAAIPYIKDYNSTRGSLG
jgi:S-adenosylmethionine uptake transporter